MAAKRKCTDRKAMEASKYMPKPSIYLRPFARHLFFPKLALCCSRKLSLENVNCMKVLNYELIVTRDQAFGSALIRAIYGLTNFCTCTVLLYYPYYTQTSCYTGAGYQDLSGIFTISITTFAAKN